MKRRVIERSGHRLRSTGHQQTRLFFGRVEVLQGSRTVSDTQVRQSNLEQEVPRLRWAGAEGRRIHRLELGGLRQRRESNSDVVSFLLRERNRDA